jgi:transposase
MPKIKYRVVLTEDERAKLSQLAPTTKGAPQKIKNALILLAVDQSEFNKERKTDECIAQVLDIDRSRIYRVKRDCVEHSLEEALTGRIAERGHRPSALNGEQEARLVAMACGESPEGRARWTVRLLAEHLVELKIVDEISYSTVSRVLKKRRLSLG